MTAKNAAYWKERLQLQQHPEGGAYRRTFSSSVTAAAGSLPTVFKGMRHYSSAIFFLLEYGNFSAFHRLHSEEMWHFYTGYSLTIYEIAKSGRLLIHTLGSDFEAGERFQVLIPAGSWFGSRVEQTEGFALVGCTVTPGFDFSDFELASRAELVHAYPQHATLIRELTRE